MDDFVLRFEDQLGNVIYEIKFDKKSLLYTLHYTTLLQKLASIVQGEIAMVFQDEFSELNIISSEIEWNAFIEYAVNNSNLNSFKSVFCIPQPACKTFLKQKTKELKRSKRKEKELTLEQIERRRLKRLAKLQRQELKEWSKKYEWEVSWPQIFYSTNNDKFQILLDMNNILLELQLFRKIILNEKSNVHHIVEKCMTQLSEYWILKHENQIQHLLLFFDLGLVNNYSKHSKIVVESVKPLFQTSDDAIVNTVQRVISNNTVNSSASAPNIVVVTNDVGLRKRIKKLVKEFGKTSVHFMNSLHWLQGFISEIQQQHEQQLSIEQITSLDKIGRAHV